MASEGTSTNPDNLQKNYVEEKEKTANLKRKNILLENDLKKIRKTADSGQQNNEIEEIKRKYQQLIEESNKKDEKILSLEQQKAKKKNKRGKKKFKPGRLQREMIKKEKAAATTTSADASLDEVKQSFVEKASDSSDDSGDEFVQSSSNMTKAVDNNLNYVKFIQIKNEWKKEDVNTSCVDLDFTLGNGYGNVIGRENIKYTNSLDWKNGYDKFVNASAKNLFKKLQNSFYSLYYFEVKCIFEKEENFMGIDLRNLNTRQNILFIASVGTINESEKNEEFELENNSYNNNDVFGCGLVYPPINKLNEEFPYIFYTQNGKQIGKGILLKNNSDLYEPSVSLKCCSIKANFGNNLETKPFKYDILKHDVLKEFY
ncbi:unnamed protein product [Meloidogyne enterolobii]|uniref:Uncharacterized protein n=1 Tax=Meloidogyne enterolobii TaxID=390850 RepID=A0ACB0ZWG5_MELEN